MRENRRRGERRERIVNAAIKLFADADYAQVSMDDIASAAGVAKGTLYNYFRSKEELYVEVIRYRFESLVELLGRAFDARNQPWTDLRSFVLHYEAFMHKHPHFFKLLRRARTEPGFADEFSGLERKVVELLASVLKRGMRAGEFRNGSAEFYARLILGMVEREVDYRLGKRNRARKTDDIVNFIRMGLCRDGVDVERKDA